ncbi:hypothetical protein F5X96DRAFT_110490 [Biscogniauxia mediterranea]|nr:hypothetical protein F5X96DRAFT_110490 [Biscogniauxia mediterranea]
MFALLRRNFFFSKFQKCIEIGRVVNAEMVSIGSTLDHSYVPGRQRHEYIADNACMIGTEIHNKPMRTNFLPRYKSRQVLKSTLGLRADFSFPFSRGLDQPLFGTFVQSHRPGACFRVI